MSSYLKQSSAGFYAQLQLIEDFVVNAHKIDEEKKKREEANYLLEKYRTDRMLVKKSGTEARQFIV